MNKVLVLNIICNIKTEPGLVLAFISFIWFLDNQAHLLRKFFKMIGSQNKNLYKLNLYHFFSDLLNILLNVIKACSSIHSTNKMWCTARLCIRHVFIYTIKK